MFIKNTKLLMLNIQLVAFGAVMNIFAISAGNRRKLFFYIYFIAYSKLNGAMEISVIKFPTLGIFLML